MKKSRFTDSQIAEALKRVEAGRRVAARFKRPYRVALDLIPSH
jgi:hypothetical protein